MKKFFTALYCFYVVLLSIGFTACTNEKRYSLTVNGNEYLYSSLDDTYKAGEEVCVKVKIKPYEGVKVLLDSEPLVKSKSTQDEYWYFSFAMPAHAATLDISTFKDFDEPLLYGFHLTFNDKNGDPIEKFNKPINSEEAIAMYATPYYDENGIKVYTNNVGANVFADTKEKIGGNTFELESTLYFTYELLGAISTVDLVYFDEKAQEAYIYGFSAGYELDDVGYSSIFYEQNLSDFRFDSQMKEYEAKFASFVKLNIKYLDYLTDVKVLEYGANNELIKCTDVVKFESEKTHYVSEYCEYVIVEEEYTVKNKSSADDQKYYERSVINKSEFGGGKLLKYPRGDGLITPVYLSIKWQAENEKII